MYLEFFTVFLLTFALGMFIAGIFTVYFGSGKSRGIGAGLLVGGIIVGLIILLFSYMSIPPWDMSAPDSSLWWVKDTILDSLVYLISAILGGLAAVGLFLLAIMKS
ncbi:MAG: hypothetical protein AYK23_04675 [Candidatus Proteinoplasmatales archaeon SG8-5]|nr:MAG: hypothetical protein AYK23_04675 [Candidatus Proteinoplasmatales archaeon SG8-5]